MNGSEQETINNLKLILQTYRKTLVHWQLQAGRYGGEAFSPPQVAHGIQEAKDNIRRIKAALNSLGIPQSEEPIDGLFDTDVDCQTNISTKTPVQDKGIPSTFLYKMADDIPEIVIGFYLLRSAFSFALDYDALETTGEKYRVHQKSHDLLLRSLSIINRNLGNIPDALRELVSKYEHVFRRWFGETRHFISAPGEDMNLSTTTDQIRKEVWYAVNNCFHSLNNIPDESIQKGVQDLVVNPLRFLLWGFSSQEEHEEWIRPTLKTLLKDPGPFQTEFLKKLLNDGKLSLYDAIDEGIPEGISIEAGNCLVRGKYCNFGFSSKTWLITPVGRRILQQQLDRITGT